MGGVPAAAIAGSTPQRCSSTTAPRISACVESVSAPYTPLSSSSTLPPPRAMSIAVAAPPHRAPAMMTSYFTTHAPLALSDTLAAQHAGDVIRQLESVAADAVDEARVPAALKVESEDVQARHGRDAAVVEDFAAGVEHRDSPPPGRPTVPRRPERRR